MYIKFFDTFKQTECKNNIQPPKTKGLLVDIQTDEEIYVDVL